MTEKPTPNAAGGTAREVAEHLLDLQKFAEEHGLSVFEDKWADNLVRICKAYLLQERKLEVAVFTMKWVLTHPEREARLNAIRDALAEIAAMKGVE